MKGPTPRVKKLSSVWWLQCAHTLFWVTMITILIWIYADVKYTDEVELKATLELNTGDSKKILTSKSDHPVTFTLTGAQAALERFQTSLAQQDFVLKLDVSKNFTPGKDGSAQTRTLLEKATGLQELGISIKNIQPADITIRLDSRIQKDDITVKLDARGAELESEPAPQKASILVSQSKWNEIETALAGAPPVLKTTPVNLKNYSPGPQTITLDIIPMIADIEVKVIPDKASFEVKIINSTETKKIRVRVLAMVPPAWEEAENSIWNEYVLVRKTPSNWQVELKITGLQKDLLPENIYAFIRLTEDDKKPTDSWLSRDVIVTFPPDKNLALVGTTPKVMFKLQKRSATPN
ncbi:MAG: hypothetical protein KAR11_05165 [Phycisphaerae bacterium]|nr:hypothetical protein [Phycisphaerae bacterium]